MPPSLFKALVISLGLPSNCMAVSSSNSRKAPSIGVSPCCICPLGIEYLPDALFVVDAKHESIAVSEAKCLGIPTFGLVDTNTNPNYLDFPIPSNDDSIKSIKIILDYLSDSIFEVIGSKVTSDIPSQVSESPKVENDTQSESSDDDSNVTKK